MTARVPERTETLSLAIVFGLASVPWTYGFVAGLAGRRSSLTFYAAGGGLEGLRRGYFGNLVGVFYAAATIGFVGGTLGGGALALSLVVGAFMFLASLHEFVDPLSFAPAGFFGYATLFGLHDAGAEVLLTGLGGEVVAAAVAMLVGAAIGFGTELASDRLAGSPKSALEA